MLSKEKAVEIIRNAASVYNNIMNDKNLLIVMANKDSSDSFSYENVEIIKE